MGSLHTRCFRNIGRVVLGNVEGEEYTVMFPYFYNARPKLHKCMLRRLRGGLRDQKSGIWDHNTGIRDHKPWDRDQQFF